MVRLFWESHTAHVRHAAIPPLLHYPQSNSVSPLLCRTQAASHSLSPVVPCDNGRKRKTTNIQPALVINPGSASLSQGLQQRLEGRIPLLSSDHTSHLTGPPEAGKRQLWSIKKTNSLVDMNTEA